VLIDFGAARKTVGTPTRAITSLVTYGYAPFEQYNESDEKQGAWTDIYALGACLYLAVNGKLPLEALARGSSLLSSGTDPYKPASVINEGHYSPGFLRAIDHALMFHAKDRPQDTHVWADMLSGKIEAPPLPKILFKPPASESDEDATVLVTRPPSVPPRRGAAPPDEQPVTTPGPETMRPESRFNIKVIVSALFVLSIFAVGAIVYWGEGEPPERVERVEEPEKQEIQPQLASLLVSAEKARKAGKLLDTEGGAIYLYQQVLNIDPANPEAAKRIQEIIELYADGIRSDLAEGFDEKVQSNIQLLQAAVPDSTTVLTLLEEIRSAKAGQKDISLLLQQAETDFKAGRLISPKNQNALSKYRSILAKTPDNPDAKKGIETILTYYITLAKKNLARGDTVNVERNINDILTVDPDSVAVKKLRDELQAQHQKVAQLLSQAQRAFEAGNITRPANKNALTLYQRVLKLDPKNTRARQGVRNVEKFLKSLFEKHLSAADFVSAKSVMRNIEKAMPRSRLARDVRAKWEQKKQASRPDIEVISELIGKFKQGFESRNIKALRSISDFQANRQAFLQQFYNNYTSFRLDISGVKFIGRERKGTANIAILDLINKNGVPVEPGTWSRFEIVIRRNAAGQWKVIW
jgi:tetratricopeptide (TPR) repeat protein